MGWNDRLKIEELKDLERVLISREVMLDNMARIQKEMQAELQRINLWKETTYNCTPMGGYPNTAIMREWVLDLIDCMMAANEIRTNQNLFPELYETFENLKNIQNQNKVFKSLQLLYGD